MLVLVAVCLLICMCALKYRHVRLVESRAHPLPPPYPGYLPIIGHTLLLINGRSNEAAWQLVKNATLWSLQHKEITYLKLGGHIHYMIADPEDALLVANTCLGKHYLYSFAKGMVGEGLITGSGEHWRRHREMLKSNFTLPIINGYLEVFNSQSRTLLRDMECYIGKGQFNPSKHVKKITLGTSYLTTFGKVGNEKFFPKYMKAVDDMLRLIVRRFHKFWLQNEVIFKLLGGKNIENEIVKVANEVSDEILETKRSFVGETNCRTVSSYVPYLPLIDLILQQHHKNKFTDNEITEELHTSIMAAYETTAHSLENILVMIGSFPEVQEKLYNELMEVLGADRDVDKDDLRNLVYTEAVIQESLRMLPTAPTIARFIDKDVKLKNYTLRAGSQCIISMYGVLHHSCWGPDVDEFRPERWLDTTSLPANYITDAAFSLGKRSCIGKTYAMTSLKILMAHIVRKYKITADHTKLRFWYDLTIKAMSGNEISLERRVI